MFPRRTVTTFRWSGLTLADWRASEARVKEHRVLLSSPHGREMIAVLMNTMPIPTGNDGQRTAGYYECLQTLFAMAAPVPTPHQEPEARYTTTVEDLLAQHSAQE